MTEPNEFTNRWNLRLLAAQRDLVEACGGIARVVERTGYSKSQVGRWNGGLERDLMPLAAVLMLEADAGRPLPPAPIPEPPAHPMPFSQAVDEERCLWFAGEAYGPNGPDMPVCGGERADIPGTRYCLHHLRRQAQDKAAA